MEQINFISANSLELHYYFNDETHLMDARVQNKCEFELLSIIKEISTILNIEIVIETEPFADGGLKRWFKLSTVKNEEISTIKVAIITAFLTAIIVTPFTTTIGKICEKLIENIYEDKEVKQLEREKLKSEIENLKIDTKLKQVELDESNIIKKRRSNFYESVNNYNKVKKISIVPQNNNKQNLISQIEISRETFKEYILISNEIDSTIIDNATIEIIAPVLKKGGYKWIGIYNGETYHFSMKSNEFKSLVQIGTVEFKNGTSINCQLEIKKTLNNEGRETITGYDILRVNNYFDNEEPIETPEGKKYRKIKEAEKNIIKIDFDNPIN